MIVAKIYGGLAGQMLQYSLARHLSIKNRTKLYLDIDWYNYNQNLTHPRIFNLNNLNTRFEVIDTSSFFWRMRLTERLKHLNPLSYRLVSESDFSKFQPAVLDSGNNIVLDGYWNSYKYFEQIRDLLAYELSPVEEPDEKNAHYLKKIRDTNSVSVHFRRGDYALTSFHGILDKEYYKKALEIVTNTLQDVQLFIFSDEPETVMSEMNFTHPYHVIDFNRNEKNYWDIELMKHCKHNIVANSGFSWWGAWLNNNLGKRVVAPKKWINHKDGIMENIPKDWISI